MSKNLHKTHLLELISDVQTEKALDILDRMLVHGKLYADLVQYKSRYREIRAAENRGIIEPSTALFEKTKFNSGLISFISDLDERELLNQILLVSPDSEAHEKLAEKFKSYFPNTAENFSGKLEKGDFAFVVCNDFFTAKEKQEDFDKLIQDYIDAGYFLVCATENNQKAIVGANRKQIHGANSQFALFARVREMIDFVRYFSPTNP